MAGGNGIDLEASVDAVEYELRRLDQKIDVENGKVIAELRELRDLIKDNHGKLADEIIRLTKAVLGAK